MASTIGFLLMVVFGFAVICGIVWAIIPPLLPVLIIVYLICIIVMFIETRQRESSVAMMVVGAPAVIGCLAIVFFAMLFAWIPSFISNFYLATVKGMFRLREKQSRVEVKTQQKFDKLGSGYHFRIHGEIDKNTSGRKGKIIYRQSYMYLGGDFGWITTPGNTYFMPPQLSVDTGEDTIEFKTPPLDVKVPARGGRYYGFRSHMRDTATFKIPDRPKIDDSDLPIGTRHEWEVRVDDELIVEGQIALQYRKRRGTTNINRRIKYETLQVVNPHDWQVYQPDEDDITLATYEREHRQYQERKNESVLTVETIADFLALDPGQRFVIHGRIHDSNETLWKDYIYYKPGPQFNQKWNAKGGKHHPIEKETYTIEFPDGVYDFDITLPFKFFRPPRPGLSVNRLGKSRDKVTFPQRDLPKMTEGLQTGVRCYDVLKVGDRVIVHGQKLPETACEALNVESPSIAVSWIVVNTNRDWVMHGKDDRSPAEISWLEDYEKRIAQRQAQKRTGNNNLRKALGLPDNRTGRFGQSSGRSRFGSKNSSSSRFGNPSGQSRFSGSNSLSSRFGKSSNTTDNDDEKPSNDSSEQKDENDT